MLTSRVPRSLVDALDKEAARLRGTTGLPCSRTAALVRTLRRALADLPATPVQVVEATPLQPVPVVLRTDAKGSPLDEKALRRAVAKIHGYTRSLAKHLGMAPQTVNIWVLQRRGKVASKCSWPDDRLAQVAKWLSEQS
jgi:hypothetical protein